MATNPSDVLALSDEEFAKLAVPTATAEEETETKTEVVEETTETGSETTGTETQTQETVTEDTTVTAEEPAKVDPVVETVETDKTGTSEGEAGKTAEPKDETKVEDKPSEAGEKPNYEEFYQQILGTPLKANGKEIKLNSPDEVIQLMQQGANYTRKMQELAPARKVLMMLQNNGLLDEDKLSFFIDLDKGDPEALKKFIKDKNIDIDSIDTLSEPDYKPGNNQVTDQHVVFNSVLEEVSSTPEGKQTLQKINTTWDEESKQALWASPEIMSVIHQQRETGVYDLITTEMERQIALGKIPAGTPFLSAYKTVGDEMAAAAQSQGQGGEKQPETKPNTVLATRAATPKPKVDNGDKASAASPTRAAPKQADTKVNPLAMSDAEFMKHASVLQGRV